MIGWNPCLVIQFHHLNQKISTFSQNLNCFRSFRSMIGNSTQWFLHIVTNPKTTIISWLFLKNDGFLTVLTGTPRITAHNGWIQGAGAHHRPNAMGCGHLTHVPVIRSWNERGSFGVRLEGWTWRTHLANWRCLLCFMWFVKGIGMENGGKYGKSCIWDPLSWWCEERLR